MILTDLRHALRTLLKSPGFSALVVSVLAIGIGATTAIFTVVNGVLLKPLPFVDASRLVTVTTTVRGTEDGSASFPDIEGRPQDPGTRPSAAYFAVSPDYFTALGIRVVRGRAFTDRDNQQAPNVAIISETLAKRYWPADDPIGKRITVGYNNTGPREIVGIVADVKHVALTQQAQPGIYTAFPQTPWPFMAVVVRAQGDPATVAGSLRAAVTNIDPDQAAGDIDTLTEYVAKSVAAPRFTALLVGSFAICAVLLAGFGLFSVTAYSVAQRRREIGIRMALGAQPTDVRALVVTQALRLGGIGLLVGLAGALAVTRIIQSLLFEVSVTDPATFIGVSAALVAVLLLAAYLAARRATRVDPLIALRTE